MAAVHGVTERQARLRASWGSLGRALTPGLAVWGAECRGAWRHWSSGLGRDVFSTQASGIHTDNRVVLGEHFRGVDSGFKASGVLSDASRASGQGPGQEKQRLQSAGCADTAAGASCRLVWAGRVPAGARGVPGRQGSRTPAGAQARGALLPALSAVLTGPRPEGAATGPRGRGSAGACRRAAGLLGRSGPGCGPIQAHRQLRGPWLWAGSLVTARSASHRANGSAGR